ncbi:hypothetical protein BD560DRAFT_426609 [Blakeslea trispora]|nr:hypothetical protein BD560DRAFT_426609 [Blakeslea trispora]
MLAALLVIVSGKSSLQGKQVFANYTHRSNKSVLEHWQLVLEYIIKKKADKTMKKTYCLLSLLEVRPFVTNRDNSNDFQVKDQRIFVNSDNSRIIKSDFGQQCCKV